MLSNNKTCNLTQKHDTQQGKRVNHCENFLPSEKKALSNAECENVLSNAKMCYPTRKHLIKLKKCFTLQKRVIQHKKRVFQLENVSSHNKTACYSRQRDIKY